MRIRLNLRCFLLVSALMFSLSLCRAQTTVPALVTADFGTNAGTQLWDLTGDYTVNATVTEKNGLTIPLTVDFHINQDAMGNLRGGGTNDFRILDLNSNAFAVGYRITGKVTGSGGAAQARFTVRFVGDGNVGSLQQTVKLSAVMVVNASPNPVDGALDPITPAKFSARLSGGLESVSGTLPDFDPLLPPGVDGTWTLTLQMLGGRSLDGSATITTGPGQVFGFTVTGPVNSSGAVARLRGSRAVSGTTISGVGAKVVIFSDVAFDDFTVSGKVMGQQLLAIPGP